MKPTSTLWDRAVLNTIAIRERLASETNLTKRSYLKHRLNAAKEREAELEAQFLDAVRDGEARPIFARKTKPKSAPNPKPSEHHRRQFFLSFLAMNNTKKQRLFRRYKLTGADQTAAKLWEAAR